MSVGSHRGFFPFSLTRKTLMAKLFISIALAFAIGAAALGFMAKNNINQLQSSLKGSKDDLHREQGKLQAANVELKKSGEDLSAANDKLKETLTALESKGNDLKTASDQLAEAQKQVVTQLAEVARLQKVVEDGKVNEVALQKSQADLLAANEKLQKAEAENAEFKQLVALQSERLKATENQPKDRAQNGTKPDLLGLQGKILAVNPGWNFVVLSVGDKHGVLVNAPLLVVRGNTPVARLRVTSVEKSTSVADVVQGSTARGVTVQPGDTVIFEGRTSATELTKPATESAPAVAAPKLL